MQALNQLDEERRWRERAQQQVPHVATLARKYNYEEQEQSRKYHEEMQQTEQQLVHSLPKLFKER